MYNQFSKQNERINLHLTSVRLIDLFDKIQGKINKPIQQISIDEFEKELPELFIENEVQLGEKIAELFYNYRLNEIQLKSENKSDEEIIKEIGVKPWIVLKEIINEAKLDFQFNDPSNMKIRDSYQFRLYKVAPPTTSSENVLNEVALNDLSSGEKVLISLIFLLYNSQEKQVFPKLFLLDEPDAHLHPSMSKQLVDVLKNVLVDKYGARVIMTTHSPSTVVMTPEENIYVMSSTNPRISKSKSKNETISLLTEGLVYVGEGTKYFIVEDKEDVDFYTEVYSIVTREEVINRNIPMVFIPASVKEKTGGKTVVESWVTKLKDSGLAQLIHGIIDEDSGNVTVEGVFKIYRYSIENYLVDPIVTYAALIDKDLHNDVIDVGLKIGEEYKLKSFTKEVLQSIADAMFAKVQSKVQEYFPNYNISVDSQKIDVRFINNQTLLYPYWIIKRRGKTILQQAYNATFNSTIINHASLFKAFRKIKFIPLELSEFLSNARS